ncbi:TIGR00270 family protein [Candidatus Micrarchaeota archaeon]|nr:TIGR00270 family protein [Candidatus Micrarchaeota archaeon]
MSDQFCDICGRPQVSAQVLIEGAKLLACASCRRGGKTLHEFSGGHSSAPVLPFSAPSSLDSGEEIIENPGKLIKQASDRLRLPLPVIAERLREKESYLHGIENGHLMPSLEIARKLEKELSIKLIDKVQLSVAPSPAAAAKFSPPTLGDMLTFDRKKKDK